MTIPALASAAPRSYHGRVEYRKLGKTGLEISEISLGAEHLRGQDPESVRNVVHRALDSGINYIDLVPCVKPEDRDAIGFALEGRRDETMLSAHFGIVCRNGEFYKTRDPQMCLESFEDLLERLNTDYIDVLMMSWVDKDEDLETVFDDDGYLRAVRRIVSEGRARCVALSTHVVGIARKAIRSGLVEAVMFPVNPAHDILPGDFGLGKMWDETTHEALVHAGSDGGASRADLCHLCEKEQIGLIAMKPYAGGLLLESGPMEDWLEEKPDLRNPGGLVLTPVQCISYVLTRPGVSTALVGCRSPEQVDAALAYCRATDAERSFSAIDADELWKLAHRCVYCNHCLPCPEGIEIGQLLRLLDAAESFESTKTYDAYKQLASGAADCTGCEVCMERCPFGVPVTERMDRAVAVFGT